MSDLLTLLKASRFALIALAASVATSCLLIVVLHGYNGKRQGQIEKTKNRLTAMRTEDERSRLDLGMAGKLKGQYHRLAHLGFIGEPDRNDWMQRLEDIYRTTRLPADLRYTFLPARTVDEKSGNYRILHHELTIELSGIDDLEFLDFMERLSAEWQVPYLIQGCQITREQETGLQIRCTLQLYSMSVKAKDGT